MIAGGVTVGSGSGRMAALAQGQANGFVHVRPEIGPIAIQGALSFAPDGLYEAALNSNRLVANKVTANGVSIATGAQITLRDQRSSTLPPRHDFHRDR